MCKALWGLAALGAVSLAVPRSLTAQETTRASFAVGGGAAVPVGDFDNATKVGWLAEGSVMFHFPSVPVALRVDGQYDQFKFDAPGNNKVKLFGGLGGLQYEFAMSPTSVVKPYINAGAGAFNVDPDGGNSETKFAAAGGAGINFGVSTVNVFVEGRYINVFTSGSDAQFIPITAGIRFGGGL